MAHQLETDWHYDGTPDSVPRDQVRELVGDIDKNQKLVTDTAIALALAEQSNSARMAASKIAEKIAAKFMKEATSKSGKDYSRTMDRSKAYLDLADRLKSSDSSAVPNAAQVRVSTSQAIYANNDLRRGAFRTGMFHTREHDPRPELRDQDLLDSARNEES